MRGHNFGHVFLNLRYIKIDTSYKNYHKKEQQDTVKSLSEKNTMLGNAK